MGPLPRYRREFFLTESKDVIVEGCALVQPHQVFRTSGRCKIDSNMELESGSGGLLGASLGPVNININITSKANINIDINMII